MVLTSRYVNELSIWPVFATNIAYQLENAFQTLNIGYCELTSLLVLRSWTAPTNHHRISDRRSRRVPTSQISENRLLAQNLVVSEFVARLLKGEAVTSQLGRPLTPTAYIALLPTVWSLLNNPATQEQDQSSAEMLQIVVEHATKTSSKSALKRLTIEFVARLILVCFIALFIR
jgi:pre-rRNA-processing protein IPI1